MSETLEPTIMLGDVPDGVRVRFKAFEIPVEGVVMYRDQANGTPVVNIADDQDGQAFPWGFRKTTLVEIIE